ncbi:hypothetical protein CHELA40_15018 [Chelatococcus asaccharovorans]|nr:hypothetical protein CHELA17_60602 [Chelatococcus asaccharovorans]CAH1681221.1 hypothetical protein CHELA40_15018 [Chelatococcus asaccharovorans]
MVLLLPTFALVADTNGMQMLETNHYHSIRQVSRRIND